MSTRKQKADLQVAADQFRAALASQPVETRAELELFLGACEQFGLMMLALVNGYRAIMKGKTLPKFPKLTALPEAARKFAKTKKAK